MFTIKAKGVCFAVASSETGDRVIARNTFEVQLALDHWLRRGHAPQCCPVCRAGREAAQRVERAA